LLILLWSIFSPQVFADSVLNFSHASVTPSHIVTLPISNAMFHTPGQGWVLYGDPKNQTPLTLSYAVAGYDRYNWSDIEPKEGLYNWSLIDKDMNAWKAVGKLFAFGVMNANSSTPSNPYVTPKWVFNDGAHFIKSSTYDTILGLNGIQYVPVWNDPIFLRKVQDFAYALAHRYDGNPNIAYIDDRSYGNWGVQDVNGLPHSVALSPAGVEAHIQLYLNAFKHTQLIVPWGPLGEKSIYVWAVSRHTGLRRDGLMVDSNGSELTLAAGKEPIIFEFYSSYQWLKQRGFWSNSRLITDVNVGEGDYISLGEWGNDAQALLAEQKPTIDTVTNLIGFRIVVNNATIPNKITNQQSNTISFSWKNRGVGYVYQPIDIAVALLTSANQVVQKQWLPNVNPHDWKPGITIYTHTPVTFTGIPSGTYKLAVGLFAHKTDTNPTYQMGNTGRTSNDWYVLSSNTPIA
jgi:hypothetical protein